MNLIRWNDPFRELATLQNRLNQAFDSTLARPTRNEEELFTGTWAPPVDIIETKDKTILKAELPGFDENQIQLRFEDGVLSLEGERKFEKDNGDENYHRVERSYGKFVRSFTIPSNVDNEHISAAFDNGILTVELPKREETKPKADQDHAGEAGSRGQEEVTEGVTGGERNLPRAPSEGRPDVDSPSNEDLRKGDEASGSRDPRKTERELRTILETIPAFVWTARPDGAIDFITGRLFAQTGLRKDETLMWEWANVLHPEDRERVVQDWRDAIAAGRAPDNEMRVRGADGTYRWFLTRAVPLRDDKGDLRWYGTFTDIDARKRANRSCRSSKISSRRRTSPSDEVSQTSMF